MEHKVIQWLKKNFSNIIWVGVMAALLFSTTAKEYLIRAITSTGITTSSFENSNTEDTLKVNTFSVVDTEEKFINVEDLEGKIVFINFWASWCPPCRAEFPSIQKFYNEYKTNSDIIFLMINMDDDLKVGLDFLKDNGYQLPTYQLGSNVPSEIYEGALPTTVVLDRKGKIRFHHTGAGKFTSQSFKENIEALLKE